MVLVTVSLQLGDVPGREVSSRAVRAPLASHRRKKACSASSFCLTLLSVAVALEGDDVGDRVPAAPRASEASMKRLPVLLMCAIGIMAILVLVAVGGLVESLVAGTHQRLIGHTTDMLSAECNLAIVPSGDLELFRCVLLRV